MALWFCTRNLPSKQVFGPRLTAIIRTVTLPQVALALPSLDAVFGLSHADHGDLGATAARSEAAQTRSPKAKHESKVNAVDLSALPTHYQS